MGQKSLSLNQQLALLPVAIPDSILDFLEDFNYASSLQTEMVRNSFDADYLRTHGDALKAELEAFRADMGPITSLKVDQAGRELPGAYFCKIGFEKGEKGLGITTRLKEKTILRVDVLNSAYNEEELKNKMKQPKV